MEKYSFLVNHYIAATQLGGPDQKMKYKSYIKAGCNILCIDFKEIDNIIPDSQDTVQLVRAALADAEELTSDSSIAVALVLNLPQTLAGGDFDTVYDYFASVAVAAENDVADFIILRSNGDLFDSQRNLLRLLLAAGSGDHHPVPADCNVASHSYYRLISKEINQWQKKM